MTWNPSSSLQPGDAQHPAVSRNPRKSREYPSAPIVGVGAVVIRDGCVLLVRRGQPPLLGEWSIPGGAVELGETLGEAVIREVREETGLAIAPCSLLKTLDRIERDPDGQVRFHYVLVDFLCSLDAGAKNPKAATDVSDVQWAPLETVRRQQEFALADWTLEVIEQGVRWVAENSASACSRGIGQAVVKVD